MCPAKTNFVEGKPVLYRVKDATEWRTAEYVGEDEHSTMVRVRFDKHPKSSNLIVLSKDIYRIIDPRDLDAATSPERDAACITPI